MLLCVHCALSVGDGCCACVGCVCGECGACLGFWMLGWCRCSLCVLWMTAVVALCCVLCRVALFRCRLHVSVRCGALCAALFQSLCTSVDRPVWPRRGALPSVAALCCVVLCCVALRCSAVGSVCQCVAVPYALLCSGLYAPLWTVQCGPAAPRGPTLLCRAMCCAALR